MAVPPGTPTLVHMLASTPFLVIVLNAVVAGAIAAVVLVRFVTQQLAVIVLAAVVVAIVVALAQMTSAARRVRSGQAAIEPMFPTPGASGGVTRILGTDIPDFVSRASDRDR